MQSPDKLRFQTPMQAVIIFFPATVPQQKESLASIVIPVGLVSVIILFVSLFVLYRRKKIYGGFYLFSYPPLPDYMASLDENGNIQELVQKLPFIPEWEFPRERITFGNQIL